MSDDTRAALIKLSDTTLMVADPAQDVRGRTVRDRTGEEIGTVDDLLIDDREHRVRFLEVAAGGFLGLGERTFLIPAEAITRVDGDHVHVDQTRERITGAPRYDPVVTQRPDYYASVYNWYGYAPYWAPIVPPDRVMPPPPAGTRVGGRWEVPIGSDVVGADGEKVGEVIASYRDYVVVEKGFFFPTDYFIPASAIAEVDRNTVRLRFTREETLRQGWDALPPEIATGGAETTSPPA